MSNSLQPRGLQHVTPPWDESPEFQLQVAYESNDIGFYKALVSLPPSLFKAGRNDWALNTDEETKA